MNEVIFKSRGAGVIANKGSGKEEGMEFILRESVTLEQKMIIYRDRVSCSPSKLPIVTISTPHIQSQPAI